MRAILAALILCLLPTVTEAKSARIQPIDVAGYMGWQTELPRVKAYKKQRVAVRKSLPRYAASDPRPRAWCGWWLRHELGIKDKSLNLARNWAKIGRPASGPAPGVVAVFSRRGGGHVGIVVAVKPNGRIVLKSGNDGGMVRVRERSARGVIAWRWV